MNAYFATPSASQGYHSTILKRNFTMWRGDKIIVQGLFTCMRKQSIWKYVGIRRYSCPQHPTHINFQTEEMKSMWYSPIFPPFYIPSVPRSTKLGDTWTGEEDVTKIRTTPSNI